MDKFQKSQRSYDSNGQKSGCTKTRESVIQLDSFAETFRFKLPEGKMSYRSCKGCTATLVLIFLCTLYCSMQLIKLLTFDETDVMVSQRDAYFDSDQKHSRRLMFAFGITDYDRNPEPIEDPSVGILQPYYKSWGIKSEIGDVDFEPLPTRECTEAELHVNNQTDPNSLFFKPHPNSAADLGFYYKKLKCLDQDALEVQGDYNSPRVRSFVLLFEKCDNSTFNGVCQSPEYIKSWLARKFVVINTNQERFSTRDYEYSSKVSYEAKFIYIPVNSQMREEVVYKVQLTDLNLQDTYYQFSALTEDDRRIFRN